MIQFKCSCCNQLLQLGDEWAGKVAKCPYSGQFMQVPFPGPATAPAPMPATPAAYQAQAQAPAPMPARAPAGREIHNPFEAGPFVAPTPAPKQRPAGPAAPDFVPMTGTVSQATYQQTSRRTQQAIWRTRGTLLGIVGGAAVGAVFGLVTAAMASSGAKGEMLLVMMAVVSGGAVLGAGAGGLIGPAVLLGRGGIRALSTPGAVHGAMYGTARVVIFGALGGVIPGVLRATFILLADSSRVGEALTEGFKAMFLIALGWAAAGAILGIFFGAVLGALGGYES